MAKVRIGIKRLRECDGNIAEAARRLAIPRRHALQIVVEEGLAQEAKNLRATRQEGSDERLRPHLRAALKKTNWCVVEVAVMLHMSLRALYRAMERLGLKRPRITAEEQERRLLDALAKGGWTQRGAGQVLGITFQAVQKQMDKLGVNRAVVAEARRVAARDNDAAAGKIIMQRIAEIRAEEDTADIQTARDALAEIEADPSLVVSGKELDAALDGTEAHP